MVRNNCTAFLRRQKCLQKKSHVAKAAHKIHETGAGILPGILHCYALTVPCLS